MADSTELFDQLREFKWRDVSFPTTEFTFDLRQDLAIHKYPDRDGAHIEATGRSPYEFTARIPFTNNIYPAKNETWGVLYPDAFRAFLVAFADRSDGVLQHPELGSISAKPSTLHTTWSADRRDGVIVEATWLESTNDPLESTAFVSSASPITTAVLAGADLDAQITEVTPPLPPTPVFEPTFADTMRQIQAVSDSVTLFDLQVTGKLDEAVYRANAVLDSLDRAANPQNWPVRQSCQKIIAASLALKGNLATKNKRIARFTVQVDGTIGLAALASGSTVSDLLRLNPDLALAGIVTAGQVIRIYEAA